MRRTDRRACTLAVLRLGALWALTSWPLLSPDMPAAATHVSLEELARASICRTHAARADSDGTR
ncbi:MAG: hypothetical protein NVV69_04605 [Methyloversatilis sp.]|uniref:hypothetical protein n=1 Tax=Methyloversatilis sp. TaxID=2569862 RepID=UPI0025D6EF8D|nr:hypothetical protein [Methyloversatilis sp.]MCR6665294.1 hypothetical protein [Methyloversatilis sp.]